MQTNKTACPDSSDFFRFGNVDFTLIASGRPSDFYCFLGRIILIFRAPSDTQHANNKLHD